MIVAVNPYEDKLTDDVVKDYYKQYYNLFDGRVFDMGLPDKFTYECCSKVFVGQWPIYSEKGNGKLYL